MELKILDKIRERSRDEWRELFRNKWVDLRILVQENGEWSCIASFILGIFFVLAFKLFFSLAILAVLAIIFVLNVSEPRTTRKDLSKSESEIVDIEITS